MPARNPSETSPVHRISGPGRRARAISAYSLMEVIAVVAIIAILATVVVGVGRYAMKRARIGKARGTFHKLELAIGLYQKDFGAYIPDSAQTVNGQSLRSVLAEIYWPRRYTDPFGKRRSKPILNEYDKPSEILFFFLQDMYDAMNYEEARGKNRLLLADLPRKEAYVKFKKNELRDADDDGLPEIVDGWGKPFLYVCADIDIKRRERNNVEPHEDKNPNTFSLYSFGPDKLGYYEAKQPDELDYPVGETDRSDLAEMKDKVRAFESREGYSPNKDNITNWERMD